MQLIFETAFLIGALSWYSFSPAVGGMAAIFGIAATIVIIPARRPIIASIFSLLFLFGYLASVYPQFALFAPFMRGALQRYSVNTQQINATMTTFGFLVFFVILYNSREVNRTEDALESERARADAILANILPEEIATRLKNGESRIADSYDDVSILFADVVNFTEFANRRSPDEVVSFLDTLFRQFDRVAHKCGLEKIKTIGDAYMAAAGVPKPVEDHRAAAVNMALEMNEIARAANSGFEGLRLRIGINSGSVIAGVIGEQKFLYDLWGDAVNTSSRMESHGLPGEIQVTAEVAEPLRDRYVFETRGCIEVKGIGSMPVFLVKGRRA